MAETARSIVNESPRPFAGATGKGVRIAVVDSGVNSRHPHVKGVAGGIMIGLDLGVNSYTDDLGHGTAVLAAIKEKAPDAEYYAVKICYKTLKLDIEILIRALEWALHERMHIINLSLGTRNLLHAARLAPIVEQAAKQKTLIVSAAETESTALLPGSMPGVLGVALDWTCSRDSFRYTLSPNGPRWLASGYARTSEESAPNHSHYGVSFSTANMTGFVARALQDLRDTSIENVSRTLREEARRLRTLRERSRTM
ncbi:MAG: S8 family serine peptidase [Bryobacteraceae bacterium]